MRNRPLNAKADLERGVRREAFTIDADGERSPSRTLLELVANRFGVALPSAGSLVGQHVFGGLTAALLGTLCFPLVVVIFLLDYFPESWQQLAVGAGFSVLVWYLLTKVWHGYFAAPLSEAFAQHFQRFWLGLALALSGCEFVGGAYVLIESRTILNPLDWIAPVSIALLVSLGNTISASWLGYNLAIWHAVAQTAQNVLDKDHAKELLEAREELEALRAAAELESAFQRPPRIGKAQATRFDPPEEEEEAQNGPAQKQP